MNEAQQAIPRRTGFAHNERPGHAPVQLFYEEFGAATDPTVLLVMGLGAQMLLWPTDLCEELARLGFHVVRFDNRDIGLSSRLDGLQSKATLPFRLVRLFLGLPSAMPYSLHDMASDAIAVLDHVGAPRAHVVGASMGGMISQLLAADHPDRVLSLGLFFTCAIERFAIAPRAKILAFFAETAPKNPTREQEIDAFVRSYEHLAGRHYPLETELLRRECEAMWDRNPDAEGPMRQLDAIIGTGSIAASAARIDRPTVIIHGSDDPVIRVSCGESLARLIPGAKLNVVDGMGHTLPLVLLDFFVEELTANFARAQA
ncbi:alpha/beta hydrolase fold protein [Segniliparus rotundus DSM 44985]|uniref:Alpha/beta hydrolase fold protein n=1 Tax=Segniliparus rotundus (strain ATCC BAA-972 / CDC 1076 / CIP 108378 / DSM 44985 / JCM 13578) TaxID=640132 RepID=D6ZAG6_SEGRD|nr:alpha/beta hydrolase [Segniliparus rotundus]ADG96708.1 alpha/beta hydrolase fold protein [Segniliparus rotundus DSM 44985]